MSNVSGGVPKDLGPGEHVLDNDVTIAIDYGGNLIYRSDCEACVAAREFGGPSHYASPRCRSGKRPHCTCDTCF